MFYVPQDLGDTTGNLSCCSGASAEAETVQTEVPHYEHSSTSVQCMQYPTSLWLKPPKKPA